MIKIKEYITQNIRVEAYVLKIKTDIKEYLKQIINIEASN